MKSNPVGPAHPAPKRKRVAALKMLVALYGAPLAWVAQMSLSEPLAAQACYPGSRPLLTPAWAPLQMVLAAVSGAALLVALASAFVAWSVWRATSDEADEGKEGASKGGGEERSMGKTVDSGAGRTRFLAVLGLMSGGLFVAAVLFTALAVLLIAPCAGTV